MASQSSEKTEAPVFLSDRLSSRPVRGGETTCRPARGGEPTYLQRYRMPLISQVTVVIDLDVPTLSSIASTTKSEIISDISYELIVQRFLFCTSSAQNRNNELHCVALMIPTVRAMNYSTCNELQYMNMAKNPN